MNNLTPRGYLVAGILIGLALALLWYVSGHVWYVPDIDGEGGRYCLGTLAQCFH